VAEGQVDAICFSDTRSTQWEDPRLKQLGGPVIVLLKWLFAVFPSAVSGAQSCVNSWFFHSSAYQSCWLAFSAHSFGAHKAERVYTCSLQSSCTL